MMHIRLKAWQSITVKKKEIATLEKAWRAKICAVCSSKLRVVDWEFGSFWGCPKFRDGLLHSKFPLNFEEQLAIKKSNCYVRVKSYWLTDIMKKLNLPEYVKATDLLQFYNSIGFEDLREKYGYKNTKETIGGRAKAKKESMAEENEITDYLSPFFKKSQKQLGIRYKLVDQKESVAIIDLVVSDDDTVNIVEIKRTVLDVVDGQIELYKSLINFIMNTSKDKRRLSAVFIVYSTVVTYYTIDVPYITYDGIKRLKSKASILNEFVKKDVFLSVT